MTKRQQYTITLGSKLGRTLEPEAQEKGFSITALVKIILWDYLKEARKQGSSE